MADVVPQGWYDISLPWKQGMHNFVYDPVKPKMYRLYDRALGSPIVMTMLEVLSHTGTHIDCPLHFIDGGSTVSDIPLDTIVGPARVLEIQDPEKISVEELEKHDIKKGERILCKTRNSPTVYESPVWVEDYVYLDSAAAVYLAQKEILLFGLDSISVGNCRDLDSITGTHTALLEKGIYIMEGCALGGVPGGEYELLCLPIPLRHGDAGPCRAILRPLK